MKKTFIALMLSAVVLLSSCTSEKGLDASTDISENADTSPQTTSLTAAKITDLEESTIAETTAEMSVTSETTTQEKVSAPLKYPDIEIPVSYKSGEEKKGKPCRSVMDGLDYEDFPAKEDIVPAIEYAYEVYFSKTNVYHRDLTTFEHQELPCTIENLSFASGLYLDFNGDGEKESLIVVQTDSNVPDTYESVVVCYRSETDIEVIEEAGNHTRRTYIEALIYDDCIDLIVEALFGASGQAFTVYSYDNGFKKEFIQGKGGVRPVDTYILSSNWYGALSGYSPTCYIRNDNGYALVGKDEINLDELIEKIPEMQIIKERIEEIYGEEITCVKTEGYLNFFFIIGDEYITAYINNGFLCSPAIDSHIRNSIEYLDSTFDNWDGEVEYGLCLL